MSEKSDRAYRKLKTRSMYTNLMKKYYRNSRILPKIPIIGKKVAWVTSGAPVEITYSMGMIPLYPENYGALVGAAKVGADLSQVAEKEGYSVDLCSYAKSSIGSILKPEIAPMGGLTRPDVLICTNNICGTVLKWYQVVSSMKRAPLYLVDIPYIQEAQQPEYHKEYVIDQLLGLTKFLEKETGKSCSEDKLRKTMNLSNEAVQLWTDILKQCQAKPSPLNCADRFVNMGVIVTQRGTSDAITYYKAFLEEVKQRVKDGEGAITTEEKVRLGWDNIAIWFALYDLYNGLAKQGVVFPCDTYTNAWAMRGDLSNASDPFKAIAEVYSDIYLNRSLSYKADLMIRLVKEFDLDGIVMHSDRSCKRYGLGQMTIKRLIKEETGVPALILDGDMCDSRGFSLQRAERDLQTFVEMVA